MTGTLTSSPFIQTFTINELILYCVVVLGVECFICDDTMTNVQHHFWPDCHTTK